MPNAYTCQEIRVAAGSSYTFPAAGSNFSFSAGPALGVNKVIALASSQPLAVASLSGLRSEAELNSYVAGGASLDAAYFQVGDLRRRWLLPQPQPQLYLKPSFRQLAQRQPLPLLRVVLEILPAHHLTVQVRH
ncbi:MAG: DUF4384 domain-containing protein [Deinococcales bacterium]